MSGPSHLERLAPAERAVVDQALAGGALRPERLHQALERWAAAGGGPFLPYLRQVIGAGHTQRLAAVYRSALSGQLGGPAATAPGAGGALDATLVPSAPAGPGGDVEATVAAAPGGSQRAPAAGAAPERLGPYVLERELARGGMGIVYVARHAQLGRKVALKLLPAGAGSGEAERFQIEARAAAQLRHPSVVGIHDVGVVDGRHYLAMDLIEGESLKARVERGPLRSREAAEVLLPVVQAVAYAHSRSILHRDIKPHNVLLDREGRPFLSDFGLAKDVSAGERGITVTGQALGTPAYMPPEQAEGALELVDRRSDVYSLGATLYELLAGRPPFEGATAVNVITKVLTQDPVPPSRRRRGVDADLETICLRCLEKDPARRYPTAGALAADLERYLAGDPILARPVGLVGRFLRRARRNRAYTVGAALALTTLLVSWAVATAWIVSAQQRAEENARRAASSADEARTQEQRAVEQAARAAAQERRALERAELEKAIVTLQRGYSGMARQLYRDAVTHFDEATKQLELLREGGSADRTAIDDHLRGARLGARQAELAYGGPRLLGPADGRACAISRRGLLAVSAGSRVALHDLVRGGEPVRLPPVEGEPKILEFSPDGSLLACATSLPARSSILTVFELARGEIAWQQRIEGGHLAGMAFSPPEMRLLATGLMAHDPADRRVLLFDVASGRSIERLGLDAPGAPYVYSCCFQGPLLLAGCSDGVVRGWDLTNGQGGIVAWPGEAVMLVAAPPRPTSDTLRLFTCGQAGNVQCWFASSTAAPVPEPLLRGECVRIEAAAWLPPPDAAAPRSDALLAVAGVDRTIRIWDGELRLRRVFVLTGSHPQAIALGRAGARPVLATVMDHGVQVWDVEPGLRLAGSGPVAFGGSGDETVLFHIQEGQSRPQLVARGLVPGATTRTLAELELRARVDALAASPDGARVAISSSAWIGPGGLPAFDQARTTVLAGGRRGEPLLSRDEPIRVGALSFAGEELLVGPGLDYEEQPHQPAPGALVRQPLRGEADLLRWHTSTVPLAQRLPGGGLVTAGGDGTIAVWSPGAERPERAVRAADGGRLDPAREQPPPWQHTSYLYDWGVTRGVVSPAGDLVATVVGARRVRLWSLPGLEPLRELPQAHLAPIVACAIAPDGRALVTASRDGEAILWDLPLGSLVRSIRIPGSNLDGCALSPDGRWLALSSPDGVWVHEVALGE